MQYPSDFNPLSKVHYRPIEAAIRWSGLAKHESHILNLMRHRNIPEVHDFPRWPLLRLNAERILDAIVNGELSHGIKGITVQNECLEDRPELTVRHVDLKAWMTRYYPEQRPAFLFSRAERGAHPTITLDSVNVLLFEREALRLKINRYEQEIQSLRTESTVLQDRLEIYQRAETAGEMLSARSETTYLNIVGGLLDLLLGQSPAGHHYSSFRTQESVMSALIAHHDGRLGISERTLQMKFAAARRHLAAR